MTDRDAKIRAERRARRRAAGGNKRLAIDEAKLDRTKFSYRWANDTGTRIGVLKDIDWEIAPEGGEKITGTTKHGGLQKTILMRKPLDLYDDDVAAMQAEIDELEDRTVAGQAHQMGEGAYVPKDTPIQIGGRRGG